MMIDRNIFSVSTLKGRYIFFIYLFFASKAILYWGILVGVPCTCFLLVVKNSKEGKKNPEVKTET